MQRGERDQWRRDWKQQKRSRRNRRWTVRNKLTNDDCHEIWIKYISFDEFLQVNESMVTCWSLTGADIIDNVRGVNENEDVKHHTDTSKETTKEAEKFLKILISFPEFE